jgi:hypothetical protein
MCNVTGRKLCESRSLPEVIVELKFRFSLNTMASNLPTQVRTFAQISTAAMDGDFTQFIMVEASEEMDSYFY